MNKIRNNPATKGKQILLSIPSENPYAPAVGVSADLPREIVLAKDATGNPTKVVPVYYFTKDVLKVGYYTHPVDGWEDVMTPEKLDGFISTFHRMKLNGVKVPFVVDHSAETDDGRGEVHNIYREGDTLYVLLSVVGEDAATQVARVPEVSVGINEIKDGKGNDYGVGIEHVSHSQYPIVPKQGPFVPLAASRKPSRAQPLMFAAKRRIVMALKPDQKSQLAALAVANGKTVEEVAAWSDDELIGWFVDFQLGNPGDTGGDGAAAEGTPPAVAVMTRITKERDDLKTEVETLKQQMARAPKPPQAPNEEVLHERGIRVKGRVDQLVTDHKLDRATADKLLSKFTKSDGKANAHMLSRHGDANDCEAIELIEIIAANNPPPKGEKTGLQTRELSRNVPNAADFNKNDRQAQLLQEQLGKKPA